METADKKRISMAKEAARKTAKVASDTEAAFKLISKAFKQVRIKLRLAKKKHKDAVRHLEKLQEGKA